jgi:hypothetical protein
MDRPRQRSDPRTRRLRGGGIGKLRGRPRLVGDTGSPLNLVTDALNIVLAPSAFGTAVWVLAIVFAWSGATKLRRPTPAAIAMVDFGVLRRVRPALGSALGAAELLLAVSLITGAFPAVSLPAAAVLLWVFVLLIAKSLWSGDRFACFCFGDAGSRLSGWTLLRTIVLALLGSVLVVALPSAGDYAVFGETYALQMASAMALVGAIVLGGQFPELLRRNKDLKRIGEVEVSE